MSPTSYQAALPRDQVRHLKRRPIRVKPPPHDVNTVGHRGMFGTVTGAASNLPRGGVSEVEDAGEGVVASGVHRPRPRGGFAVSGAVLGEVEPEQRGPAVGGAVGAAEKFPRKCGFAAQTM